MLIVPLLAYRVRGNIPPILDVKIFDYSRLARKHHRGLQSGRNSLRSGQGLGTISRMAQGSCFSSDQEVTVLPCSA